MNRKKTVLLAATLAALGVAAAVLLRRGSNIGRWGRAKMGRASRHMRYESGKLKGTSYRLRGLHPDPEVDDTVLRDRILSELGRLEKHLDLPRVHVMVEDHVARIHGEVGREYEAQMIEHAIERVSGVRGVESHLHIGLVKGDTRPSAGKIRRENGHASVA